MSQHSTDNLPTPGLKRHGGKNSKECVTLMVCANMSGIEKAAASGNREVKEAAML